MIDSHYKLVVLRRDGSLQETEFEGYLAQSASDQYFTEAKGDERTLFACTIENKDGTRQIYSDPSEWPPRAAPPTKIHTMEVIVSKRVGVGERVVVPYGANYVQFCREPELPTYTHGGIDPE